MPTWMLWFFFWFYGFLLLDRYGVLTEDMGAQAGSWMREQIDRKGI